MQTTTQKAKPKLTDFEQITVWRERLDVSVAGLNRVNKSFTEEVDDLLRDQRKKIKETQEAIVQAVREGKPTKSFYKDLEKADKEIKRLKNIREQIVAKADVKQLREIRKNFRSAKNLAYTMQRAIAYQRGVNLDEPLKVVPTPLIESVIIPDKIFQLIQTE